MNHLRTNIYKKYKIEFNANFWTGMFFGWIVLIIMALLLKAISALDLGGL